MNEKLMPAGELFDEFPFDTDVRGPETVPASKAKRRPRVDKAFLETKIRLVMTVWGCSRKEAITRVHAQEKRRA